MEWFEGCRFCSQGRPVAMRDPMGGQLRLVCVECAARRSSRGDAAEGFGALVAFADASCTDAAQRLEGP